MTKRQVEELVAEIQLYLETVETFRSQGSEPCWQAEPSATPSAATHRPRTGSRKRRGS